MDDHAGRSQRTPVGEQFTELIDEVFRFNGCLLRAGDALTGKFGLTSARWQVLGALGNGPSTAASIARHRGLRRQSVQEIVTRLRHEGLAKTRPNPDDGRAPLVELTEHGRAVLEALRPEQARWANQLGSALSARQLRDTIEALSTLRAALEG